MGCRRGRGYRRAIDKCGVECPAPSEIVKGWDGRLSQVGKSVFSCMRVENTAQKEPRVRTRNGRSSRDFGSEGAAGLYRKRKDSSFSRRMQCQTVGSRTDLVGIPLVRFMSWELGVGSCCL